MYIQALVSVSSLVGIGERMVEKAGLGFIYRRLGC